LAAPPRRVGKIPEIDALRIANEIMVSNHGGAFAVGGPVATGHVLTGRKRPTVPLRTSQNIMLVWIVTSPLYGLAPFVECSFLVDLISIAMKFLDIGGNLHALCIEPRAGAKCGRERSQRLLRWC
jgi:hypothetical protein